MATKKATPKKTVSRTVKKTTTKKTEPVCTGVKEVCPVPSLHHDETVFFIDERSKRVVQGKVLTSHTTFFPIKDEKNRAIGTMPKHYYQLQTRFGVVQRNEEELYTSFSRVSQIYTQEFTDYLF